MKRRLVTILGASRLMSSAFCDDGNVTKTPPPKSLKKKKIAPKPKKDPKIEVEQTLLKNRVIFLTGSIESKMAVKLCERMVCLDLLNPGEPIILMITSPGGKVNAGLSIVDTIGFIRSPVVAVCAGQCSSMATVILAACDVRLALPNARIMVHSLSVSIRKKSIESVFESAKEHEMKNDRLKKIILDNTTIDSDLLNRLFEKDSFFWPERALELGLLDGIISSFSDMDEYLKKLKKGAASKRSFKI